MGKQEKIREGDRCMVNRNLDGVYFRVERDGKWQNICCSDLTESERAELFANKNHEWMLSLVNHLCNTIKEIGNTFGLARE